MPLIAFIVGLIALAGWLIVLLSPLLVLFLLTAFVAFSFVGAINGAVGIGLSVMILPVIVYLPVVFFSFLLPAFSRLVAHLINSLISADTFTLKDALDIVAHYRHKSLAVFGLRSRTGKPGA